MRAPLVILTSYILLGGLPLASQEARTPERAKRVVDEALQALGGARYLAMQDRVEEGRSYSFYNEKLSGMSRAKFYIRYLTRPEPAQPDFFGLCERRSFGKKEDVYVVYNEQGGYEITYRGARPLDAEVFRSYRESLFHNVLYTLRMRMGEPGMTLDSLGADIHENQPCELVLITDSGNRSTKVWFHRSTKLPVKQQWERRDPKTRERIEEITLFDKYRDAGGGVMWPWVVRRERNGFRNFEMFADSVAINQGLTDDLFTLSSGTKVLDSKSSGVKPGKK
ncbi:MAG: hypothetical protein HY858_05265 [Candidatus Solibacter usitatus]|nr:hypothetical protein [Candidatus Solibacter usitatus]